MRQNHAPGLREKLSWYGLCKGKTIVTYALASLDPCSEKAFGCDPYPDFTAVALLQPFHAMNYRFLSLIIVGPVTLSSLAIEPFLIPNA